jgi:rhodanese-related sulfurtransferase
MTHKTGSDLISEARTRIREVSASAVKAMMERGDPAVYLDVREPNEYNLGHLPGALHIPRGYLELKVESVLPRDATVVAYCSAGIRSALAADTLQQLGYMNAVSLTGGWREWMMADGPVEE